MFDYLPETIITLVIVALFGVAIFAVYVGLRKS